MKTIRLISAGIILLGLILLLKNFTPNIPDIFDLGNNNPSHTSSNNGKLMINTETPCSPTFNYKYDIKVGGPVKIKFPGVTDTIYWNGTEDFNFPDRESGPVYIASNNPSNPNVWVKIWKK